MEFRPGSLVHARNRDWVVLPSSDKDLLLLKPLGGSEDEITGIYLPLRFKEDELKSAEFSLPTKEDIGDISSAKTLYNASRLSFRNGAGPFRSIGKLSFRPRSYQMVPLIMALRQNGPLRLLIADDVGVGKTIEALLILKELLERGEINRFAVIALPHLCEQWQTELKEKFGIDAVIIRSNTQARLDREIPGDTSVYDYYPYQVISIDYIKSENRREVFIQECPDFVIVDEAHTCSKPSGSHSAQQQRHYLINRLSQKKNQNLVLLTATPHSGKQEEFSSLLTLINSDYANLDLPTASQEQKQKLAKQFVQRRRADIEKWLDEDTPFPERDAGEFAYELSKEYAEFYEFILEFALGLTQVDDESPWKKRVRYWTALGLLRGVMSSPAAGIEMLKSRASKLDEIVEPEIDSNPLMDEDYGYEKDYSPTQVIEKTEWTDKEKRRLTQLADLLSNLQSFDYDYKAAYTLEIIKDWLVENYNPVIFCRFIATANYLGALITPELHKIDPAIDVQVVTSEDPDEVRKSRIEGMDKSKKRVLIATDCLSEGINLQDLFTAVLHYDLPWNPNRLEQREGRVDRFGQRNKMVQAYLLYGTDNPIDGVVLKVLLRKVREIRKSIGISLPFPEDSQSLMDAVLQAVLLQSKSRPSTRQLQLDFGESEVVREKEIIATKAIDKAADREKLSRSIFAQHAIKANEIEQDLKQTDEAIGDPKAVEVFVIQALDELLGVQVNSDKKGFIIFTVNLPEVLKTNLPNGQQIKVSFKSPTPEGYYYLGRNHPFVEQLCQYLLANSINHDIKNGPARAAVIKSKEVEIKTTLLLFRVRNVIEEKQGGKQIVDEEMLMWGYRGMTSKPDALDEDEVKYLMEEIRATGELSNEARTDFLENELNQLDLIKNEFDQIALKRTEILIEAHERFRKVLGGSRFKAVEPILPMDLMGLYILLPD